MLIENLHICDIRIRDLHMVLGRTAIRKQSAVTFKISDT